MGNLNAKRDWGSANDYVESMWMMLKIKKPSDYVIATGRQISVREFILLTAENLGIELEFSGHGAEETAKVKSMTEVYSGISIGDVIIKVDPAYYRPSEVETLLGNPAKAKKDLGWVPETSIEAVSYTHLTLPTKA